MELHLQTKVKKDYLSVFNAFDEQLFKKLSPPFPKLKLLRFDGSEPGDIVEVDLDAGISSFRWTSIITQKDVSPTAAYFVDEGQELPPPLRTWKHKHLVTKNGAGAIIHDVISYSTGFYPLDLLLYPLMRLQFGMRKPIYQQEFGKG